MHALRASCTPACPAGRLQALRVDDIMNSAGVMSMTGQSVNGKTQSDILGPGNMAQTQLVSWA
eukprot:366124-Chlamydomonas_euryale.AAC.4